MNPTVPIEKHVVLVGAGNAHLVFLRRWRMSPWPGVAVTLVSEFAEIPYSAMVPGQIAGEYRWDEITIDLVRFCRSADSPPQPFANSAQGGSFQQLHGIEPLVVFGPGGVDLDQVGMLYPPQRADLSGEAGLRNRVSRPDQTFEGHLSAQRGLQGAVDDSHASLP